MKKLNLLNRLICCIFILLFCVTTSWALPVTFKDDMGNLITITKKPLKVVSLSPSITEMIFKVGAGDALTAVTYHSSYPTGKINKQLIGGFFSPSLDQIKKMGPDLIFYSGFHKDLIENLDTSKWQLVCLKSDSIADSYETIKLIGKIFDKEKQADIVIEKNKKDLKVIKNKTSKIPADKRKRVMRLMGRDNVMTPGDDSFQNELIRAAGGIPPMLNKNGNIVPVSQKEWIEFNPQVIYGCGNDKSIEKQILNQDGWKDVDAVKNNKIFYFPCDLTCRVSTNSAYFVSWLSSLIYNDEFSKKENQVLEEKVVDQKELNVDLKYIKNVNIAYSYLHDFINKTLILNFKQPMSIVSTLEGQRDNIESIGNHYSPPPCWLLNHSQPFSKTKKQLYDVIGKSEKTSSFLFTGADMDKLSIQKHSFKDMDVYALVTAGVMSNAVRMAKDIGNYYEPGTINIIIMSNMSLTKRAMTRAIISATEGKTAALMDMDIRSTYGSTLYRATGTGTDNIIVVQGQGTKIDNAGGHTKMGELIAKAVYAGVQEAIYKQNGLIPKRNIFQRLHERKISIMELVRQINFNDRVKKRDIAVAFEHLLLNSKYAGFLETSLCVSDDYEKGLISDLSFYDLLCNRVAEDISNVKIDKKLDFVKDMDFPIVIQKAFNAILNGLYNK